jgi:hypothetical protein
LERREFVAKYEQEREKKVQKSEELKKRGEAQKKRTTMTR